MSDVKYQMSNVKCQMSNVKCQISNVKCKNLNNNPMMRIKNGGVSSTWTLLYGDGRLGPVLEGVKDVQLLLDVS